MIETLVTIKNDLGLHARASGKLVDLACKFSSDIKIGFAPPLADAKSILKVMMLAASKGSTLTLLVSGDDEKQACEEIVKLISNGFDEH